MSVNFEEFKNEIKDLLEATVKQEAQKSFKEKSADFSWNIFFKTQIHNLISANINQKLMVLLHSQTEDEDKISNSINAIQEIQAKSEEITKEIEAEIKRAYHFIEVKLEDKMDEIVSFFNECRGQNFVNMSQSERNQALANEDLCGSELAIYHYLKMTHMDYKYLYQNGSVLQMAS